MNKQSTKINKEPKTNKNNLEKSKTISNLEEPKINNNILNKQSTKKNKEPKISNHKKSNFVKTTEFFIPKKAILNPQTIDDKSFQDSITLSLNHKRIGKNFCRPKNIRKYSDTFNWGNINCPPTQEDYKQSDIDKEDVNLNILSIKGDVEEIDYIYRSQFKFDRGYEVNLSLLENKHYACVKNLKSLLS